MISGYDALYGKVKTFIQNICSINQLYLRYNTLRNLSELVATKTLIDTFKKSINALTIQEKGDAEIRDSIKLRNTRPFVIKSRHI